MFENRILILAAHPDDEVVACAAAIGQAQQQGAHVFVLYLTHGCIARETLWPWRRKHHEHLVARRLHEAAEAARFLGITPLNVPIRPARHLWRNLPAVHAEIRAVIETHAITQLWVPAYEGGNADHDALNAIGSTFLPFRHPGWFSVRTAEPDERKLIRDPVSVSDQKSGAQKSLTVLEFAEYNFAGGKKHSQEFPFPNGTEQTINLTPEEQEKKRAALALYASEQGNLNYVRTERECFRPLAAYDYSRPAHPGTLWYTRFHWVPLPHPRVDFTRPEDVAERLNGFLLSLN